MTHKRLKEGAAWMSRKGTLEAFSLLLYLQELHAQSPSPHHCHTSTQLAALRCCRHKAFTPQKAVDVNNWRSSRSLTPLPCSATGKKRMTQRS